MMDRTESADPLNLIWAIIVFPALAASVFVIAPVLVGELVTAHGLSGAEAGYVMSAEFSGAMLAALTSYYWLSRVNTAGAVKLAIVLSAAGHFASGLLTLSPVQFTEILALRFFAAMPNGAIMVICFSTIPTLRNVERGYALHTLGQLALGGIGVVAFPLLFAVSGLYAAYFIMGLMCSLTYPLAKVFPKLQLPPLDMSPSAWRSPGNWSGIFALLGLLLFYTAGMGVWAYAERIGIASGISVIAIGTVLALTTACGFIGAAAASLLAGRASQLAMILLGMVFISLSITTLGGRHSLTSYSVAISAVKFSWTLVLPFILGLIASLDHSKRLAISGFIAIQIGTALGPAVAAARLGESADYDRVVISSLCLMALSGLVLSIVALKARSQVSARTTVAAESERICSGTS